MQLDFEKYQARVDNGRKKTKRSERDNAALEKAEIELIRAKDVCFMSPLIGQRGRLTYTPSTEVLKTIARCSNIGEGILLIMNRTMRSRTII